MKKNFSFPRSSKVADLIKHEVAVLFVETINDPRLRGITITDVRVTDDLSIANVYYVTSDKKENKDVVKALESVKGFIKREIARATNMRRIPELDFHYDDVFENGLKLEETLRGVKNEGR
ncbi:MAG: 30S ribosome-binding factor RbfA [Pseudomonadota bacterium]